MASNRIFNIIINSKHTPTGIREAVRGLKSIGEAGFFIRQGLIQPLQGAISTVIDLVAAANPERIARLTGAFDQLKVSVGSLVDDAVGPLLDGISNIVSQATLLSNLPKNLAPIYDDLIKRQVESGKSAVDLAREVRSGSDSAVEAARREKAANPGMTIGVNAEDAAIKVDQFRAALIRQSRTFDEYVQSLRAGRIVIKDAAEEFKRFAEAKGMTTTGLGDVIQAQKGFISSTKTIEQELTKVREDAALNRGRLLQDIAIREGDRLADLARANAQQLGDIDKQRTSALQTASSTFAQSLADIDANSARDRIKIEEGYQERIKQIKDSSDQDIEEAIRRRDARALAAAYRNRNQQLTGAEHDRDKSLRDQGENVNQQRDQARRQYEEQKQAAEDVARTAIESLRRQNQQAQAESRIAYDRQLRDFNIAAIRRQQDAQTNAQKELANAQREFQQVQAAYRTHLAELNKITNEAAAANSPLMTAVQNYVTAMLGWAFNRNTSPARAK